MSVYQTHTIYCLVGLYVVTPLYPGRRYVCVRTYAYIRVRARRGG